MHANDGSIQAQGRYCLTVENGFGGLGASVVIESCIAGALNQQWQVSGAASSQTRSISSAVSGLCLNPVSTSLTANQNVILNLAACSVSNSA